MSNKWIVAFFILSQTIANATSTHEDPMTSMLAERINHTPQQQIADKLIIGFHGTSVEDPGVAKLCAQLKAGQVGGVILFSYNIINAEQTKKLVADLKSAAGRDIWVAVDQEGGRVQRLGQSKGFTNYLSPLQVAKTMTPEQAYDHYKAMALELASCGINLNFGCVIDLHGLPGNDNGACPIIGGLQRSYGCDVDTIVVYASAFVRAHRDANVVACLKHYPGHGLAAFDSHAGLVNITHTHKDIEREPFRRMIQAGLADMIMTAHLVDDRVDPSHPISLSAAILNQWLRKEDGFKGLIITDDLHMGAIGDRYELDEAIQAAIQAGSDIIIVSNNKNAAPLATNFQSREDLPQDFSKIIANLSGAK